MERDPKGLYAKAQRGEVKGLPGYPPSVKNPPIQT
jgi:adenylylsulfate kinase-like enzyme